MNNKILFFLPSGSINDATAYYIKVLEDAFKGAGYQVVKSSKIKALRVYSRILTIEAKWFFFTKLLNPSAVVFNWFQGVVAEEAYMVSKSIYRKKMWNFFEKFTLKFSTLNIYVSAEMKQYFEKLHHVGSDNFFIMPCFNKEIRLDLIRDLKKYSKPTFVYAGSLAKWQCVDETLELYSLIEKNIRNTKLTLLTKDKEHALKLIEKYEIKNFDIKYVVLDDLEVELSKYKYGFLLRNDHVVNNVATPTKMNSYLSVGVIPIYSDVISDFKLHLSQCESFLVHNLDSSKDCIIDNIHRIESLTNIGSLVEQDVSSVFQVYYNRDKYYLELLRLLTTIKEQL